jgi:GT2 family glycosyltransferase
MLRYALQRLVRIAPAAVRRAWRRLPTFMQRGLVPFVYPLALGRRGGSLRLDVPAPEAERRFDVVVAAGGTARRARPVLELAARGHRVIEHVRGDDLATLAQTLGIFDAVVIAEPGAIEASDVALARRLGFRVAREPSHPDELSAAFPRVSVIIVAYAELELVRACLASIARNTAWPALELIVVENGDARDRSRFLRERAERGELRLLKNAENAGFARATNQGIRAAGGEYALLLNDDTVVAPGWLSRLIGHLEQDPKLALVCPTTNEIGNLARVDASYRTLEEMEVFALRRSFAHVGERAELDTAALFCALLRRETFDQVGLLDECFEVGMFEDDDLSRRIRARGSQLAVARDAFVHHVGQASFGRLDDRRYLEIWERNRRRFEQKWRTSWSPPART